MVQGVPAGGLARAAGGAAPHQPHQVSAGGGAGPPPGGPRAAASPRCFFPLSFFFLYLPSETRWEGAGGSGTACPRSFAVGWGGWWHASRGRWGGAVPSSPAAVLRWALVTQRDDSCGRSGPPGWERGCPRSGVGDLCLFSLRIKSSSCECVCRWAPWSVSWCSIVLPDPRWSHWSFQSTALLIIPFESSRVCLPNAYGVFLRQRSM